MIIEIIKQAMMITAFVFVMMLVLEYVNVQTSGVWQKRITQHKWGQYVIAGLLGALPGCLGAFVVVAMHSHRIITMGAVVTAMIATSGDEAFIMFAMIPNQVLIITIALFVIGNIAGAVTDIIWNKEKTVGQECAGFQVHSFDQCTCFPYGRFLQQWKELSVIRGVLTIVFAVFIVAGASDWVGPSEWNWIKSSILILSSFSLFIVSTVPSHFLEEHIWNHVVKQHLPQIFLWTFGTLLLMQLLTNYLNLESMIVENRWIVLLIACLVGLIPESGPHLIFVTLYAQGTIPLSILLASSIVQDGHGMLPMLAHSRKSFIQIKLINFMIGLLIGMAGMVFGL